ncbi:hypothetical protein GCM10009827_010010 [Dactylosporangium maewongense]|uniref:Uncharacterized protein n=1 Tax=Dactylosporangium maewongense TaxID=634393 RepID=A0ABN1ZMW8_9ACTN
MIRDDNAPVGGGQAPQPPGAFQTPPATPPPTTTTSAGEPAAPQTTTTSAGGPAAPQTTTTSAGEPAAPQTTTATTAPEGVRDLSIWDTGKADEFRHRWHDVQTHFVEDPRGSVTEARQLVDEAMQALSASVHEREDQLERAGARSSDSTEGMRDTVLRYHQLLDRLLTV